MAMHPKYPAALQFARIEYFAKVDISPVEDACTDKELASGYWLAVVSFYYEHQCKVWFGYLTEVWATATSPDFFFVPVQCIKSRVAYCNVEVDFGRIIGKERVNIVSPLSE